MSDAAAGGTARQDLAAFYLESLLSDTLPFWFPRCVDDEHGGFLHCFGRRGELLDTDKSVWAQGRMSWLLATFYTTVEPREEWLTWARHGLDFLRCHGFDDDGRMFFLVTREGRPLRKRRYAYSEAFAAMAFAAYARAAGDEASADEARRLYAAFCRLTQTPGLLPPKTDSRTRPCKSLGGPMIRIGLAQVLRETLGDDGRLSADIDRAIEEIREDFLHPELGCVLETVGPRGEFLDHFDGRLLNPGHAIEAAWFILHEARHRGVDADLVALGTQMLDQMWRIGWDESRGGLFSFVDCRGLPVQEYWHDMKFWWPHAEAIIATLLAWRLTRDARYATWHRQVHDWAHAHFSDTDHGEWYGYLHRDGSVSVDLKGNLWKSAFHLPRMQWYCWRLLSEETAETGGS